MPKEVGEELRWSQAVMLAAGDVHTTVVTHDRALWVCGSGEHGRLGFGIRANGRTCPLVRVGAE